MAEDFNVATEAENLRSHVKIQMHNGEMGTDLLGEFVKLSPDQLSQVARKLEDSNAFFSTSPQVQVERENGCVKSLTFFAGNFDFGKDEHDLKLFREFGHPGIEKRSDDGEHRSIYLGSNFEHKK